MADVLITPAGGKIDFKDSGGNVDATIQLDGSGNLNITNPGGDISIGDTTADIYIGDGVSNVDLIFEQNGEIRGTGSQTITLGQSGDTIKIASGATFEGDLTGYVSGAKFSNDSETKDDITTRTESGFWETATGTTAEGWPITNNTWQHLIAVTHSNNTNYYSMQIGGSLFDNVFYGRKTNGSGSTSWVKFWTDGNDGSGSGLDADLLDGYNSATAATANTVAVRDGSGNLSANVFSGTATAAQYADLAERYSSDGNYDFGTVLVFGGDEEVTQSTSRLSRRIAGVVSVDPAYLMNSELEGGVNVALVGRVPCKVVGPVAKGDMMVSSSKVGHAEAWREEGDPPMGTVIGKSLENKTGLGEGVIEVVVGRM